jgi:hypothetical protein
MEFLHKSNSSKQPEVSIILLDWSVRESFHTLEYLNRQKIDRSAYEILWIEFYERRSEEITSLVERYENLGLPCPVDIWIVMDNPRDEYYHKHRMYNLGIINSSGRILTIMDSDAIVKTTFVNTIIEEFSRNDNLVLHFEEIRNFSQKFYPFNFPTVYEILGDGCTMPYKLSKLDGGKVYLSQSAISLREDWDLIHKYNYGACFCAERQDIIRIGGADQHIDYMGHICGPYEMTFRLINAGFEDKIHLSHFLYHVWHPNQGGDNNYCGPNNGRGMSTTAMDIPTTGRILPLVENEAIRELRLAFNRK